MSVSAGFKSLGEQGKSSTPFTVLKEGRGNGYGGGRRPD